MMEIHPERTVELTSLHRGDRANLRPLIGIGLVLALGMLLALLGCATPEEEVWQRLCYEKALGQAENGMLVVRHFCVKEEEK